MKAFLSRRGGYLILAVSAILLLSLLIQTSTIELVSSDFRGYNDPNKSISTDGFTTGTESGKELNEPNSRLTSDLNSQLAALDHKIDLINDLHGNESQTILDFLTKLNQEVDDMKSTVNEMPKQNEMVNKKLLEDVRGDNSIKMEQFFKEQFARQNQRMQEVHVDAVEESPRQKLLKKYGDYRAYKKARIEERINGKMYLKVNVSRMPDIPYEMKPPYAAKTDCKEYHEPIDVVFTWVNGTDPAFLKQLKDNEPAKATETGASRFKDMNQLKYAIRSFQKYAPWVRDIILVTNGQVPVWLNTDHPNVRVVTHKEIFDPKHLPSFSSPAIEINMHKIPGLSNRFIYSNDDFFLMRPICPDTFITADDELILYPKEGKQHQTAYGGRKKYRWNCDCPKDKYANGKCDNYKKCNKFECFWDGHDCDDVQPLSAYYIDKRASYHQSVDYTQLVLDRKFKGKGKGVDDRTWNPHMPAMHDKRIIEKIWEDFPLEAELTSSHTRRKKTDLQFQIMFIYYTKESPRNKDYEKYPYFKHVIKPQDKLVGYYAMKQDWKYVVLRLVMARQHQKVFNCLNDDLSHDGSEDSIASYFLLEQFYEEYFPDQTPMENFNYYPHDLYADLI